MTVILLQYLILMLLYFVVWTIIADPRFQQDRKKVQILDKCFTKKLIINRNFSVIGNILAHLVEDEPQALISLVSQSRFRVSATRCVYPARYLLHLSKQFTSSKTNRKSWIHHSVIKANDNEMSDTSANSHVFLNTTVTTCKVFTSKKTIHLR